MNQQDIIDEMKVLPVIEPEFEIQRRIDFIKRQLKKVGLKKLLLGISW
jgi:NAD+ synthase